VQQLLPIHAVYEDGIFELPGVGKLKQYSMTYQLRDIDYFVVSHEHRQGIVEWFEQFIKSLDEDAVTKVTVANVHVNRIAYEQQRCHALADDACDPYRQELNGLIMSGVQDDGHLMQVKYVTTTVTKPNISDARTFFARVHSNAADHASLRQSRITVLDGNARLRLLHDWLRKGEELYFSFDLATAAKRGHTFRDYIVPESIERNRDYLVMDGKYVRTLYIRDFPSYLRDSLIRELTSLPKPLILSYDMVPCNKADAEKAVSRVVDGLNADAAKYTQRQFKNMTMAALPPQLEQKQKDMTAIYTELHDNDQRIIFVTMTVMHMANSLEELNEDTETLLALARKSSCQMAKLYLRQEAGMLSALPIGVRSIKDARTMLSEPSSMLLPYTTFDRQDENGLFCGFNRVSLIPVFINRAAQQNGSCVVLGVPGSGKSFFVKYELIDRFFRFPTDQFIVVDPEREYSPLIDALGGNVIDISAASNTHLNAMELKQGIHEDEDPMQLKAQYIQMLCETAIGTSFTPAERSALDRATCKVFYAYLEDPVRPSPTLKTLYDALLDDAQTRPESKSVADALYMFVEGSMNLFAHQSNISLDNRLLCFDIHQLGGILKPLGMFVIFEYLLNLIKTNRQRGIRTWVYFDEWHLMFRSEKTREVLYTLWKLARKYGAYPTGITQNVSDLLKDEESRSLVSNSEYLTILNQSSVDRDELAELLALSIGQTGYITNAQPGSGLIRAGGSIIPFTLPFPRNSRIYDLITTKPDEVGQHNRHRA